MALADEQISVGGFVMGAGTPYTLVDFNPWTRSARSDQTAARAWADGSWSGAQFAEAVTVPMTIHTKAASVAEWNSLHEQLLAAFGPASTDVELRWKLPGMAERLMFGRPQMVEPDVHLVRRGRSVATAAFVGLDPKTYSGDLHSVALGLPSVSGGLLVPVTAPLTVDAVVTAGRVSLLNVGTAPVGLTLRIDGPVSQPRVSVLSGSDLSTLQINITLVTGQWLDIDTGARTVYMNGTASRRGNASGVFPVLPAGQSDLAFDAAVFDVGMLTASWRDAWR